MKLFHKHKWQEYENGCCISLFGLWDIPNDCDYRRCIKCKKVQIKQIKLSWYVLIFWWLPFRTWRWETINHG